MTTAPAARGPGARESGAMLTIAWYTVVLAVVFTTAFWLGRLVGPEPAATEPAPVAPHAPAGDH